MSCRNFAFSFLNVVSILHLTYAIPMVPVVRVPTPAYNKSSVVHPVKATTLPNTTIWIDCDDNPSRTLHFTNVIAEPSVVHAGISLFFPLLLLDHPKTLNLYCICVGDKQVITKTGFSTVDLEKVFVTYHQYYYVEPLNYWFEFLRVTVDLCKVLFPSSCPYPSHLCLAHLSFDRLYFHSY